VPEAVPESHLEAALEAGPGATGPAATGPAATGPAATGPAATGPGASASGSSGSATGPGTSASGSSGSAAASADSGLRRIDASATPLPTRALAGLRNLAQTCAAYYRDPLSWLALGITSVILCYGGGAAMFWYHAEHLGEGGPNIPWHVHWLLDSTFGFLVLTPALALILPVAGLIARSTAGRLAPRTIPAAHAALTGVAFALVTTPGPIAHDLVVGRGTWVATQATTLFGEPGAPPAPSHEYSLLATLALQLGYGLPVYLALVGLAVLVIRSFAVRTALRR
jgi:hypothetical protein